MDFSCEVDTIIETFDDLNDDSKCRLCGITDVKNVNIFASSNHEKLLTKIYTVYPIIIYKDDPLPKYICRKCIYNVGFMFNDIQKVLRNQIQLINDVRGAQPEHDYFKLLDLLEQSNEETRNFIKSTMQQDIDKQVIYRSMVSAELDTERLKFKNNATIVSKLKHFELNKKVPIKQNINNFTFDYEEPKSEIKKSEAVTNIADRNGTSASNDGDLMLEDSEEINQRSDSDIEDEVVLSQLKTLPTEPVKCTRCDLTFDNLELLSTHQVIHINLSIPKIFEKKQLPKTLRRGRLITVEERKCIRCLNCWRVFADNKAILNHWSMGDCDFYCQICGMEFPQSPKMLREHIPAEHGISYRTLKTQREFISPSVKPSNSSNCKAAAEKSTDTDVQLQAPTSSKIVLDEVKRTVAAKVASKIIMPPQNISKSNFSTKPFDPNQCPICDQMFQNGKARNSHMRKHKPSYAYGDVVLPPNATTDAYANPDGVVYKMPTQYKPPRQPNILQTALLAPTNAYTSTIQARSPLPQQFQQTINRGVRTKFVPPREDPNYVAGPSNSTVIKVRSLNELQTNCTRILSPPLPHTITLPKTYSKADNMQRNLKFETSNEPPHIATMSAYETPKYMNSQTAAEALTKTMPNVPTAELSQLVKEEPMDMDMEFLPTEAASSLATCEYCSKCFLHDDDLRLHKAQVHRTAI